MQPLAINIQADLVNLAHYRKTDRLAGGPDPLLVLVAYAQDELLYERCRIVPADAGTYAAHKNSPDYAMRNALVNKFGQCYPRGWPLLLHRRLADVIVDAAMDMRDSHTLFTVVMDGLRTYEAGLRMQKNRPDLVESGMLARAGASAHNRALAVDSKLFQLIDPQSYETWMGEVPLSALEEADEHGHLDDEQDMSINSRFYTGPMSGIARKNRLTRLIAWQRASVKNRTPIANLLAEFWDDRLPGSPSDMWRILACRLLCLGQDANPATNPAMAELRAQMNELHRSYEQNAFTAEAFIEQAHALLSSAWQHFFTPAMQLKLEQLLGPGGGSPPPAQDFLFHEWLANIHDRDVLAYLGVA